jgi:curved DNA-binding protein CbpA/translation initiation factor IF-1
MLDYSFNGLSVIAADPLRILPGDQLTVEVPELNVRQRGRVCWTAPAGSGMRLGIAKSGMPEGSLLHFPLSDTLIGLHRALKTGVLIIQHGATMKKLYIRNGDMINAASNLEADQLGRILLRQKKLTEEHFSVAMEEEKKTGRHHSEILIRNGHLKPEHLVSALKQQTRTIIDSIFSLRDAYFSFQEVPFPSDDVLTLNPSMSDLLYHQLKKHADTGLIREYLFDHIVNFSASPLKLFQHITMDERDKAVLSLVDGRTTIEEIIRLAPYDQVSVMQTVYALLEARILEIQMDGATSRGIAFEKVVDKIQDVPDSITGKIETLHSGYKQMSYYEVLGIHQNAAEDEIKKAYFKLVKEFHPDLHFNLPRDMKNKLLEIFVYMTEAYLTLKDPQKRREYLAPGRQNQTDQITPMRNEEIAEAKYGEGLAMFRKGEFEKAAYAFASALYFDNSVPRYHFFYGRSLGEIGKYKDALEALGKSLALKPSDPDTLAETGHIYLKLGFSLRATGYFKQVLEKNPSHARAAEGMQLVKKF